MTINDAGRLRDCHPAGAGSGYGVDVARATREGGMMAPRVYVVGDVILDRDIVGHSDHSCPDSAGPVVDATELREGPGGAGLAAMLLSKYGADVTLVTALAADDAGQRLEESLRRNGIEVVAAPLSGSTPTKMRIRVDGRTVTRVDCGDGVAPQSDMSVAAHRFDDADAILVSDYGRGLTRCAALRSSLARRGAAGTPIVWDPHPGGPDPVPGTAVLTPNQFETEQRDLDRRLAEGASPREFGVRAIAVTGGRAGATLFTDDHAPQRVPVADNELVQTEDVDACGASDAFAAAMTVELARGESITTAVGSAVQRATAMISGGLRADLADSAVLADSIGAQLFPFDDPATSRGVTRRETLVATGGTFDLLHPGHVSLLRRARALGDSLVVCINSDESVARAKGPGRPVVPAADRARVLAALDCVDEVVILDADTPARVIEKLRPDIWVKGADYAEAGMPEASTVRACGGRVMILATIPGYSSSSVISALRTSDAGRGTQRVFARRRST